MSIYEKDLFGVSKHDQSIKWIQKCNEEIKLSKKISINIAIDDTEYEALAKIVAYLRTRTASNAVRWALVTAAGVIDKRRRQERKLMAEAKRLASTGAQSAEQHNQGVNNGI